ncbi:MAG: valine--tRNA ligase [Eggerthellaceae bacterium]|nr:valine--tRNA ligase [Eggerthellaceae bacterium]
MPKNYETAEVEKRILQKWLDGGWYARNDGTGDCTVVIPPPNVTGMLHMGHALDDTIQDTFVRFNRMRGVSTRWILGTDHAGIATQTKVDKRLKEQGIDRRAIGREKFLEACWDWTHEFGGIIVEQIKRMGCSVDFADEKFTMDPDYANAVRKVFCDWYHDGLIYRGKRIVNWCPSCTTAISDDEAEYQDEGGHLWHLRYPLKEAVSGQEYITVATTRPETMLGDTGVAVSPDDPEKAAFRGATVIRPIVDREIPIFADWHVDAGFGSGFVKVTPAHDPNDYAMGQDHDLPQVNIFDEHAVVVEGYGPFTGMTREECREAIIAWFEKHDLLDHVDDHDHSVMHCYRCDSSLEPWLSEQWFVAVDKLKGPATDVVKSGEVSFHPDRWTQTYLTWMENLKDWCISRQLWWGHRIPVFYCDACGWEDALEEDADVCPKCGAPLRQDEDVLDTWFSSQLWTFATQGWPNNLDEMQGHHPTKALVTARDIIALWVARMVMSSLYFTKQIPFEDVVIYATILAKDGSRMSKSKGNGVDPMDLINMYGADAMRFNLLTLVTNNQDVRFDADIKDGALVGSPRTEAARGFVTKIWNAARFVGMNMDGYTPGEPTIQTPADAWILSRLAKLSESVTRGIEEYRFGDVARDLHQFFWSEFCDWYIELSKASLKDSDDVRLAAQRNLVFVLDQALRLLHPAMPFVTEAIWEQLPQQDADSLMIAAWPEPATLAPWINEEAEKSIDLTVATVSAVRSTRARYGLSPKLELAVAVKAQDAEAAALTSQSDLVKQLANLSSLSIGPDEERPAEGSVHIEEGCEIYCDLTGVVDFAAERARLEKECAELEKERDRLAKKLSNSGFLEKAAPEIIEKDTARHAELCDQIERVTAQLAELV